jgi:hypothetical protein
MEPAYLRKLVVLEEMDVKAKLAAFFDDEDTLFPVMSLIYISEL